MTSSLLEDMLTPTETAKEIRRSKSTLAKDRMQKKGPRFVMLGGRIYYRRADLRSWIDDQIAQSLSEAS